MPDNNYSNNRQSDDIDSEHEPIATIRQLKRTQRQALAASLQQKHSQALSQNIIKQKTYLNSEHIAFYIANDGEIDPYPIIEHAWSSNKSVYLPVLSPSNNSLYFAPYGAKSELKLNRYNIPEPVCQPADLLKASQLDLLLLPLVAFDTRGNRVGMGGGFYDRTLSYLQHQRSHEKPALLGLAHEIQKVAQLESQKWDIPMDAIVTEKQLYTNPDRSYNDKNN